uniref:WAP four-disulfide core domain protein 5 n=1 Tax=Cyanoderma ruficeps TaxID=181631 RepID=A0A8C3R5X6_9PASS
MQPGRGRGVWPGQVSWCHPRTLQCSLTSRPLGAAEKPGACPAAAPEGLTAPCSFPCLEDKDCLGAQKSWCWHDGECPHEEKCCLRGCDYVCLPPSRDKPGECPKVRPQHPSEPCTEMDSCSHDRDCSRQEKCCFSGCAMHCTLPAQGECGSPATSTGK